RAPRAPPVGHSPRRSAFEPRPFVHLLDGRSAKQAPGLLCHARLEVERCFLCHSPTLRPWIAAHRLRSGASGVLRGGALEPEPHARARTTPERCAVSRLFQHVRLDAARAASVANVWMSRAFSMVFRSFPRWSVDDISNDCKGKSA